MMPQLFLPGSPSGLAHALRGFARAFPEDVELHEDPTWLRARRRTEARRVGIVAGGGSGHEPLHGGFLGPGLLDAVAPGQVFASPHNRQVYEASRAVARTDGVLHVVKNYTGDRINFGIAAERLATDGIPVARVLVADDVATESDRTATGRRGTAGTLFVEKIVGAAADQGATLDDLAALGAAVADRSRSIAVASEFLTSVHTGERLADLPPDRLEYGVGIHGERAERSIERGSLDDVVARMLDDVLGSLGGRRGQGVVLLVNSLGATTPLELYAVLESASQELARRGVAVSDTMTGTLVSALDMRGFSLSVLDLSTDEWLAHWRADAASPAWRTSPHDPTASAPAAPGTGGTR